MTASSHEGKAPDLTLVLYDGVCGLCNRWVQFVLRRDRNDRFRFAPLQSRIAQTIALRHGFEAANLDTLYVVLEFRTPSERMLTRSDAVLAILQRLSLSWKGVAVFALIVPHAVRNWIYDGIAKRRYRVFGRYDQCPMPSQRDCGKFLGDNIP